MEIPVYLFTGFLEAGKTSFIQETLQNEEFDMQGNTLVILCEEGIEELDTKKFKVKDVFVDYIEDAEDVNKGTMKKLCKKHNAKRVIIEYNGMWQLDRLYQSLPEEWSVYQEIFTADASTFTNFNQNMRSLVVDKLSSCELVMFNRVDIMTNQEELHKIVRSVSTRSEIVYEFVDGHIEQDNIEDPLPFNIDSDVIEIDDKDYAVWYRDLGENTQRYVGKTLKFKGIAGRDAQLGDKAFIFGRHVMTCCEDDIAFSGLICKTKQITDVKSKEWLVLTAKLVIAEHKVYGGEGPILIVKEIERSSKPEQEVATFF